MRENLPFNLNVSWHTLGLRNQVFSPRGKVNCEESSNVTRDMDTSTIVMHVRGIIITETAHYAIVFESHSG